jgi:homoserine kinase type II
LITTEAWRYAKDETLNFAKAKQIVSIYTKYRALNQTEKRPLFDLYKLSILFDCVWYFERGEVSDFFEKQKIDYLNQVDRGKFYQAIFD